MGREVLSQQEPTRFLERYGEERRRTGSREGAVVIVFLEARGEGSFLSLYVFLSWKLNPHFHENISMEASMELVEASLEMVEASMEVVEASIEVVKASVEVVEAAMEVVEASMEAAEASREVWKFPWKLRSSSTRKQIKLKDRIRVRKK